MFLQCRSTIWKVYYLNKITGNLYFWSSHHIICIQMLLHKGVWGMVTTPLAADPMAGWTVGGVINSSERAGASGSSSGPLRSGVEWHLCYVPQWPVGSGGTGELPGCSWSLGGPPTPLLGIPSKLLHTGNACARLPEHGGRWLVKPVFPLSPISTQVPQGLLDLSLHGPLEWVLHIWRSQYSTSWRPA